MADVKIHDDKNTVTEDDWSIQDEKVDEADEAKAEVKADEDDEAIDPYQPILIEDLDPDYELWEGGPTAGQAVKWKEEYGELYMTVFNQDLNILWRSMDRAEYRKHVRNTEIMAESGEFSATELSLINEDTVTEMCVVFPPYAELQKKKGIAGVPSVISQNVMEASGFVAMEVRQL